MMTRTNNTTMLHTYHNNKEWQQKEWDEGEELNAGVYKLEGSI